MSFLDLFWDELEKYNIKFNREVSVSTCVGGFERRLLGRIFPDNEYQVQGIIRSARVHKVKIYPISSGKNWGLGSGLPVFNDAVIVDLSRLKKISNFSNEFGTVTIQAGVTQLELSTFLKNQNADWFVDVTGSASSTSIIGNAMERGMAYNSIRVDTTGPLEVVLGTGDFFRTGFAPYTDLSIAQLYKHGVGPNAEGLFFQSNYGIVISASIYLIRKTNHQIPFLIKFKSENEMLTAVDKIRILLQNGVLQCVPHIFNKNRLHPGISSLLHLHFLSEKKNVTKQQIKNIVESEFSAEWVCTGSIKGNNRSEINTRISQLKSQFKSTGGLLILTPFLQKFINIVLLFPFFKNKAAIVKAQEPIKNLVMGIPTDFTMPSLQWPILGVETSFAQALDPDNGVAGALFSSPVAPLNRTFAEKVCRISKSICQRYNFELALTINCISHRALEAVISIHFNKSNLSQVKSAQECIKEMNVEFCKNGIMPYRLSIDQMSLYSSPEQKILSELKEIFDPSQIISPGRYNI